MKSSAVSFLAVLSALAWGCDNSPPPVPRVDGGMRDANVSPPDAGPEPDGGEEPDGSMMDPDGGGSTGTCTFDPAMDDFELQNDLEERSRLVRLAAGPSGWGVVWAAQPDGFPDVHAALVPSRGGEASLPVLDVTADPWTERQPALAYDGGDWVAAYASNASSNYEVWVQRLDAAGAPSGSPTALTTTAPREDSVSITGTSSGYLVSWVQDDDTTREIRVRGLDTSLAPLGASQVLESGSVGTTVPQLAAVDGGAVIGFVRATAGGGEIVLQLLNASGGTSGDPLLVADTGVEGTLDVAGGAGGGAVVYGLIVGGARSEVRFRAFDADGTFPSGTKVVEGSPNEARDASITPFAGGYAVAYRRIDSPGLATLVVALLDLTGDVVERLEVGVTSPAGGRTSIETSGDGNLLVTWAQLGIMRTQIRAARIRCE